MQMIDKKEKPDLFDHLVRIYRALKLVFYDPFYEIYLGARTGAMPTTLLWVTGSAVSLALLFYLDHRLLALVGKRSLGPGRLRDFISIASVFFGFVGWGYLRLGQRSSRRAKLTKAFTNAYIETRLKEQPEFISDIPIDESTRRLRVRGRGIPLLTYSNAKQTLESQLNVTIAKIEHPGQNRELVDIVYSIGDVPDFWKLDSLVGYRDYSFPVGRNFRGEVRANLRLIPHYLIAGETGGGKSSFIRMMVTVLLSNNRDLEIYHLDFKAGMENQIFQGFDNVVLVNDAQDAAAKMTQLNQILDSRMKAFKEAKARSLEMSNAAQTRVNDREKRIVVVVDEIAELMPTLSGKHNSTLNEINFVIGRIARMGRAVGINLVVGTQKPDAKSLDPSIKANLMGIVCFPVTHFSQSTVILGNNRATELNSEIHGRAIWKYGSNMTEVQTPFLTESEVNNARERAQKFWGKKSLPQENQAPAQETDGPAETLSGGA